MSLFPPLASCKIGKMDSFPWCVYIFFTIFNAWMHLLPIITYRATVFLDGASEKVLIDLSCMVGKNLLLFNFAVSDTTVLPQQATIYFN